MTCKDCVHHDLCFDNGTLFLRYAKGIDKENAETKCPFDNFKNKADFVEVVECCKCKYAVFNKHCSAYSCKRRDYFSEFVRPTDFCSYGERRDA